MVHQLAGTEIPDKKEKSKKSKSVIEDVDLFAKDSSEADNAVQPEVEHNPEMTAINDAINAAMDNSSGNVSGNTSSNTSENVSAHTSEKVSTKKEENVSLEELSGVDDVKEPVIEIPQIEDVDYEKRTEEINNKIKADYDAYLDSAFSDDNDNQ